MSEPLTSEQYVQMMRDAQPGWIKDGKGIRGDAEPFYRNSANTNFPSCSVTPLMVNADNFPDLPERSQVAANPHEKTRQVGICTDGVEETVTFVVK